jgi:hypothetical protein
MTALYVRKSGVLSDGRPGDWLILKRIGSIWVRWTLILRSSGNAKLIDNCLGVHPRDVGISSRSRVVFGSCKLSGGHGDPVL